MEAILLLLLLFCQEIYALLLLGYVMNKTRKKQHIDKTSLLINATVLVLLILTKYLLLNRHFTFVGDYMDEEVQYSTLVNLSVGVANLGVIVGITVLSQILFWIIYFKRVAID